MAEKQKKNFFNTDPLQKVMLAVIIGIMLWVADTTNENQVAIASLHGSTNARLDALEKSVQTEIKFIIARITTLESQHFK